MLLALVLTLLLSALLSRRTRDAYPLKPLRLSKEFDADVDIVFWTRWFNEIRFTEQFSQHQCPYPAQIPIAFRPTDMDEIWCRYSHNRSLVNSAAMLAFHVRDTDTDFLPERRLGQPWMLLTQESPLNDFVYKSDKFIVDMEKMRLFDYSMSYRLDSDFPMPYASPGFIGDSLLNQPVTVQDLRQEFRRRSGRVLWLASNCGALNERHSYVSELQKYFQVDSLGKCLNTGPYPEGKSTLDVMRDYRFYLAIENSNCDQYISEKLFNALTAGIVPIVSGPPGTNGSGYQQFAPTRNSLIYLDDFPHPRDLAAYLKSIDEDRWVEFHRFRYTRALSNEFLDVWGREQPDWGLCGACRRAVLDRYIEFSGESKGITGSSLRPDLSCLQPGSLRVNP